MTTRLLLRILFLGAVAAATALLAAIGATALQEPGWVVYLLASVIGAAAVASQGGEVLRQTLTWPTQDQRCDIRDHLSAIVITVEQETDISCGALGVKLWLIPRWWQLLPARARRMGRYLVVAARTKRLRHLDFSTLLHPDLPPPRFPRLRPIEEVRLARRRSSGVQWTYGKGAIGQCWVDRYDVHFDCWNKYRTFLRFDNSDGPAGPSCTNEEWSEADSDTRLKLTLDEFRRLGGRYGAVLVTPLFAGQRWLGCITLDVDWMEYQGQFWTEKVRNAMASAAEKIEHNVLKVS